MSSADKITKFHMVTRGLTSRGHVSSRRGVIAAEYNHANQSFKIAHSLCSLADNLDPQVGLALAKGRLHDMEWTPMNRIHDGFVTARVPWTMDDTLTQIKDRLVRIHNKNASAVQYPDHDGVLRVREEDVPNEDQLDQIIAQGVADAREAIRQGVCNGQCGCCG